MKAFRISGTLIGVALVLPLTVATWSGQETMKPRQDAGMKEAYTEAIGEMKHPEYMKGFIFTPPAGMQGDPDKSTIDKSKMMKQPK